MYSSSWVGGFCIVSECWGFSTILGINQRRSDRFIGGADQKQLCATAGGNLPLIRIAVGGANNLNLLPGTLLVA